MPTGRLCSALAVVFAALIAVVLLRAESSHLHYELSQLDRQASVLRQELREKEVELARLRNPAMIEERLREWQRRREFADAEPRALHEGRPQPE